MCQTYPYPTSRTYPGIPTPEAIELPILEYVAGGQEYVFGDIYRAMVDYFKLTDEQRRMCFSSANSVKPDGVGYQHVFYKYCHDACKSLADEGVLQGRWPAT